VFEVALCTMVVTFLLVLDCVQHGFMPSVSRVFEVAVCMMEVTFISCSGLRTARLHAKCEQCV